MCTPCERVKAFLAPCEAICRALDYEPREPRASRDARQSCPHSSSFYPTSHILGVTEDSTVQSTYRSK